MRSKDKKDLFTKGVAELSKMLKDRRDELFNLRLDLSQNKLKNTKSLTLKRKEIALILTALKEKEFENARSADAQAIGSEAHARKGKKE